MADDEQAMPDRETEATLLRAAAENSFSCLLPFRQAPFAGFPLDLTTP